MPMLTVESVASSDQPSTLRRMVSAIARDAIAGTTDRIGNADRDADQHLVAGLMAERVVVGLEMIGIDHQQRNGSPVAGRAPPFAVDRGIELAPVSQARQCVGGRQFFELVLGFAASSDFARQHQGRREREGNQRRDDGADPNGFPAPDAQDAVPGLADQHDERLQAVAPDQKPRHGIELAGA